MIATLVETRKSTASSDTQQTPLSSEIVAFCSLVARITHRCLTERNETFLALIAITPVDQHQPDNLEQAA